MLQAPYGYRPSPHLSVGGRGRVKVVKEARSCRRPSDGFSTTRQLSHAFFAFFLAVFGVAHYKVVNEAASFIHINILMAFWHASLALSVSASFLPALFGDFDADARACRLYQHHLSVLYLQAYPSFIIHNNMRVYKGVLLNTVLKTLVKLIQYANCLE